MNLTNLSGKQYAFWIFFPSAALAAAFLVPLTWLQYRYGLVTALSPAGHAHEMLFGFVLALIAGYTLGQQPRGRLLLLWTLWIAARLTWQALPFSLLSQILNIAFCLLLAFWAVPRFRAAKQWRNKMLAPLLLILCLLLPLLFSVQQLWSLPLPEPYQIQQAMLAGMLLLMAFIGGRVIFPALSAALQQQQIRLSCGLQTRIEGALIIAGGTVLLLSLTPAPPSAAALMLLLMALLLLIRLLRWQPWRIFQRSDLLAFFTGYTWLSAAALALAAGILQWQPLSAVLHFLTIGALGILSVSVMLRLAWQRASKSAPPAWQSWLTMIIFTLAALLRWPGSTIWPEAILSASVLWSLAYGACAVQLLILLRRSKNPPPHRTLRTL